MAEIHKRGQGTLVRRFAFWGLAVMVVWGGQSLYTWLVNLSWGEGLRSFLRSPLVGGGAQGSESFTLPVFEQKINGAFLVSWAVVAFILFLLWKWLNRPKSGDFLIDTDDELKKVTWPSWADARNSSLIVIAFVVFLAMFLWFSDLMLGRVFNLILGA